MPASVNLHSKKGYWYAVWYDPSRQPPRIWRTLRTRDKQAARQKLARQERQHALGEYDPWDDPWQHGQQMLLADALDAYLDACRERDQSPLTIRTKDSTFRQLAEHFGNRPVQLLDGQALRHFFETREGRDGPAKPNTLRSHYASISAAMTWLIDQGYLKDNPLSDVSAPKKPETNRDALRPRQVGALRGAILDEIERTPRKADRAYVIVAMELLCATGMRSDELVSLTMQQVRRRPEPHLRIVPWDGCGRSFTPKHGRRRVIPLTPRAETIIELLTGGREYRPCEPVLRTDRGAVIDHSNIGDRLREYSGVVPGRSVTPHVFRHTFISWAVNDLGLPLPVVQEIAGHSNIETTMEYVHLSQADVFGALRDSVAGQERGQDVRAWMRGGHLDAAGVLQSFYKRLRHYAPLCTNC